MAERYLFEFDLCCASAIKRRTVIECLRLHERYERAAQNQHNIRVFKQRIPDLLHNGRECRIGLPDILELVEHDYFFRFRLIFDKRFENSKPVNGGGLQKFVARKLGNLRFEVIQILHFRFFGRKKIQGIRMSFQKFRDKRRFSDTPPSIDDDEGGFV